MTRTTLGLFASVIALSGFAYACSSLGAADALGADGTESPNPKAGDLAGDAGVATGATPAGPDLVPVDNAVILVHAAKLLAYRLCFKNQFGLLPQPDSQVMPEANVVGVQRGGAVRIGPLSGPPGEVFLFEEALIRSSYPVSSATNEGPSCNTLFQTAAGANAISLGVVTADFSTGVHLLVVRGCPKNSVVRSYSVEECGATWNQTTGNLGVEEITLTGARRPEPGNLPAQVVNLSQSLESARNGGDVVVTFGNIATAGAKHTDVASNPPLFGGASPATPAQLPYDSQNLAIYDSLGFRVQIQSAGDGGTDGGGSGTTVLDQSLAQIQKLSSPRDLPRLYYGAASNYALLLLGDPPAPDAGAGDPRTELHFLAVPVIEPKDDAGTPDPQDAGSAPPNP